MPTKYPNWPVPVPPDPPEPACQVSAPATIQVAREQGATSGTILSAPLAPATGAISGPAESLVVVTVKNFFDTPTWKAIRTVLQAAALAVFVTFGGACISVWDSGKSMFDKGAIDWKNTERVCEIAGGVSLMGGLMALMKTHDNNPSK